jgi:hypothetical protein
MHSMNHKEPTTEPVKPAERRRRKPAGRPNKPHEVVGMRFDSKLLAKVDKAAKREEMTRTAWIEAAAEHHLVGSNARVKALKTSE